MAAVPLPRVKFTPVSNFHGAVSNPMLGIGAGGGGGMGTAPRVPPTRKAIRVAISTTTVASARIGAAITAFGADDMALPNAVALWKS